MTQPILIFDSGIGGLSVLREVRKALPKADIIYVADNASFPYGDWAAEALNQHIVSLFEKLIHEYNPKLSVIACNTASTLVLDDLRNRFNSLFVGTVPAIKPAAALSETGLVSVLATPGTVKRDYTTGLIEEFASDVEVTLVGATRLAEMAEMYLSGGKVDEGDLLNEISPAFVEVSSDNTKQKTDVVVLGCTHYPLLLPLLQKVSPWPVHWLDPAPAIARRCVSLLDEVEGNAALHFTSTGDDLFLADIYAAACEQKL